MALCRRRWYDFNKPKKYPTRPWSVSPLGIYLSSETEFFGTLTSLVIISYTMDCYTVLTLLFALPLAQAAATTTFDTILLAHPEPSICPSPSLGGYYVPDADYIVCCWPTNTRTTARGPGGRTVYACCESGAMCTGAAPVMSDWRLDVKGSLL